MIALGLLMLGTAIALLVILAIHPRCALCERLTTRRVKHYGDPERGMTVRTCGECTWTVVAADASGAVESVERELSTKFQEMRA